MTLKSSAKLNTDNFPDFTKEIKKMVKRPGVKKSIIGFAEQDVVVDESIWDDIDDENFGPIIRGA